MSLRLRKIGRRHFLVGAAGFTLGVPLLNSLVRESSARAGSRPPPRLVGIATHHGGTWAENAFPATTTLTESLELFPGHAVGRGDLVATTDGANAVLSRMLTAPSAVLTPAMVAKLNVMAGLDIAYWLNHHSGAFFGNYDARDFVFEGSEVGEQIPTIDQVLAWSPKFYATLDGILVRSLHLNSSVSFGFADPANKAGEIVRLPPAPSSLAAFSQIFVPGDDPAFLAMRERRKFVVDRVHENYRALRDGTSGDAARISQQDRIRLDQHLERLFELEHKVTTLASCGDIEPPSEDVGQYHEGISRVSGDVAAAIRAHALYNDVIVAAIMCGTTRIATVSVSHMFHDAFGDYADWHNEVEHLCQADAVAQTRMYSSHRNMFEHVLLDLATKLDVEEMDGFTYLDNSLLMMVPQFGCMTHVHDSIPVISAGSASGGLRTGNFVDYRNHNGSALYFQDQGGYRRPGLAYNQLLATVMQAMGLEPNDYERNGIPGYGVTNVVDSAAWPSHVLASASEFLPFLRP